MISKTIQTLKPLFDAASISGYDIAFIEGYEPTVGQSLKYSFIRKIFKAFNLTVSHIIIGFRIRRNRKKDAVIVAGFTTPFLLLVFLISYHYSSKVFLLIHHNCQEATRNIICKNILFLACKFNYRFLLFESEIALNKLGFVGQENNNFIVVPHPVQILKIVNKKKHHSTLMVGIVGSIRAEKKTNDLLKKLLLIKDRSRIKFDILLGCPDFSGIEPSVLKKVIQINTSDYKEYLRALSYCDILVINYSPERYFFRCSGVVSDAVSAGTYVIAPDFPLLRHQIYYPAKIGNVFNNVDDLESVLLATFQLMSNGKKNPFGAHRRFRSAEVIASILDSALDAQDD